MNAATFADQWTHVRGQLGTWWDQLTEADLETVAGKKDALVRLVQEKYQYTRERAQEEVNQRLQAYSEMPGAFASRTADTVKTTVQDVASERRGCRGCGTGQSHGLRSNDGDHDSRHGARCKLLPTRDPGERSGGRPRGPGAPLPIPSVLIGVGVGYFLARRV